MDDRSQPGFPWRAWPALAWRSLLAALALGTCVFAPLLVSHALGVTCARALREVDPDAESVAIRRAGALAGVHALALAIAIAIALSTASVIGDQAATEWRGPLGLLLQLAIPAAMGAAWSPAALAPFALLDEGRGVIDALFGEGAGVIDALVRSFELSARRGAWASARDGALVGALFGGVAWLVPIAGAVAGEAVGPLVGALLWPLLAVLVWVPIAGPIAALVLARAYVAARAQPAFDPARDAKVISAVRRVLTLTAPALAALALATIAAALTPAPMHECRRGASESGQFVGMLHGRGEVLEIPGPHGLRVRLRDHYVLGLETADGGGAGTVRVPEGGDLLPHVVVVRGEYRGQPAFLAVANEEHQVAFDESGVRLDDGFSERISLRMRPPVTAALVTALLFALFAAMRLGRELEIARALDAPPIGPDAPPDASRWSMVAGRLRLGEGSSLSARARRAYVRGDARVESLDGAISVRLPESVLLVDAIEDAIEHASDGAVVAIVARWERLAPAGLRDGAMAWPAGGRLLLGDRDDAAEALLSRTARRAGLAALAIAGLLVAAAVIVVVRL